ncbi:hypothetical protein GCK32_016606, partial [Trichostrongylus colubriformis]
QEHVSGKHHPGNVPASPDLLCSYKAESSTSQWHPQRVRSDFPQTTAHVH